jgi:hypothetical protein
MKHPVIAVAFAAALVSSGSANATLSAVWLYAACSRGAVVPDSPIPDQVLKALPPTAMVDNNFCLIYFRAVVEAHNLIREQPIFCLPRQVDLRDVVRLYLRERVGYKLSSELPTPADIATNPVGATEDVLDFLRGAYPCTGAARPP